MNNEVLVVLGAGGMGEAIARRLGAGRVVLLADVSEPTLSRLAQTLRGDGFQVVTQQTDVTSRDSVSRLAKTATTHGRITQLVHTAGVSPVQASLEAILRVDLYGVALVLEEFATAIAPGGAGVIIASMAAHFLPPLPAAQEQALIATPADDLLKLPFLQPEALPSAQLAYPLCKRGNILRVQAASRVWGQRQARINSISPGVISTSMGQQELQGPSGDFMRAAVAASGTGRLGTASDIAAATAFLLGPDASFITGVDLLVDGGVIAAAKSGQLSVRR
jgi:NAD(P)-dependent dehydrogenase (short-subunit alcohol dehydrogenase family)